MTVDDSLRELALDGPNLARASLNRRLRGAVFEVGCVIKGLPSAASTPRTRETPLGSCQSESALRRARSERSASAERPAAASAEDTPGLAHRVLGHRVGSLVRRHYPHVDSPRKQRSEMLGIAAGTPALGLGSGPPGEFTPQALLCSDPSADPTQINGLCCAGNWRSPSRRCGRIWAWRNVAGKAIARTTPILMGLFLERWRPICRQQRPSAHDSGLWTPSRIADLRGCRLSPGTSAPVASVEGFSPAATLIYGFPGRLTRPVVRPCFQRMSRSPC